MLLLGIIWKPGHCRRGLENGQSSRLDDVRCLTTNMTGIRGLVTSLSHGFDEVPESSGVLLQGLSITVKSCDQSIGG